MNVLLVTYSAYPRIGGRSTYMTILKNVLEGMGHTVDILSHAPGLNQITIRGKQSIEKLPLRQRLQSKIETMLRTSYPHLSSWIRLRETERYIYEEAIRQLDLSQYDIIHAQDIFSSMACYRIGDRPPLIATFHNCKVAEWQVNVQKGGKNRLETEFIAREEFLSLIRPEKVIVPSQWLQNSFKQLNVPLSQFKVIPYGMNIGNFKEKMKQRAPLRTTDKPLILCPARLVPIKGHTFLLQALQQLKEEGQSFECWIVGNGVLESRLKEEARERNLMEEVRFLGGRDDVPAIMSVADMVVLPTLHDTFPFVIMEAQLAGRPVISTTVGGVPEMIVHEQTGLIGPPADHDFLYHSIRRLISEPLLGKQLAARALAFAEKQWSEKRMAAETMLVYEEVLRKKNSLDHELLKSLPQVGPQDYETKAGCISGKIGCQDGNAAPIVHLLDISWITLKSTQCDAEGNYFFDNIPVGRYAIMVVQGERTVSTHIEIKGGEDVIWNTEL